MKQIRIMEMTYNIESKTHVIDDDDESNYWIGADDVAALLRNVQEEIDDAIEGLELLKKEVNDYEKK